MAEEAKILPTQECPAGNDKHILDYEVEYPWYAQCKGCKEKFVLISESTLNNAGIVPVGFQ